MSIFTSEPRVSALRTREEALSTAIASLGRNPSLNDLNRLIDDVESLRLETECLAHALARESSEQVKDTSCDDRAQESLRDIAAELYLHLDTLKRKRVPLL